MSIKKVARGWQLDFFPEGRAGKRVRKTFKRKIEAEQFEIRERAKAQSGEYKPPVKDNRRLPQIGQAWFDFHGNSTADGKHRLQQIVATSRSLGDPLARNFEAKQFLDYRNSRLEPETLEDGPAVSANHLNHELAYLKAAFNKLIELGDWKLSNPLANVKPIRLKKRHPFFLTQEQVVELLAELDNARNPDVKKITEICLRTGCRWGEAQGLMAQDVHHGKIHFLETKNGNSRSVPVCEKFLNELLKSKPKSGPLFCSAWDAFEKAITRAKLTLPRGTKTHVLRHTFASHFMMDGGDLLELNKILGHESIQMTMKYAHLSPNHLENATRHNLFEIIARSNKKNNP